MRVRPLLRSFAALFVIAGVLGASACASAGTRPAGAGNTTLRVQNNLVPATPLNVYAVTDAGERTHLGLVSPGATASLRFDTQVGDRLRFVAEPATGAPIMTTPLGVSPGRTLRWDVNANVVR